MDQRDPESTRRRRGPAPLGPRAGSGDEEQISNLIDELGDQRRGATGGGSRRPGGRLPQAGPQITSKRS
jgi:hypothetical protein